ncbi:MAG: hypothetical protein AAGA12_07415 [Pseudomonadota bacterium]
MKTLVLIFALVVTPSLSRAQESPDASPDPFAQFIERMDDMLGELAGEMRPLMRRFGEQIRDLGTYDAPEFLPNGDIIIRRKPEPEPAPAEPNTGTIDL